MEAAAGQEWPLSGCAGGGGGRRPSPSAADMHEVRGYPMFLDGSCYCLDHTESTEIPSRANPN
jgi:hypothetical protein